MKDRFYYLLIILSAVIPGAFAQAPVIQKVEPLISFSKSRLIISGSGFSSTASQLQVWFDHIKGNIISSTEFSIEVEVPPQARLTNLTVVNLSSRLSAQSRLKYMPFFNGEGFDPAKLASPFSISSANAIFDIISADIDGDNKPDLMGTRNEATATTMALLMNQSTVGNISFTNTTLAALNVNAPTGHLAVGDLNLDGKPDVVASRSGATSNTIFVLTNTSTVGNPNFATPLILTLDIVQGAREVGIADLDGDGKPEIVVANSASNNIYVFRNQSTGGTLVINPTPDKFAIAGASESLALELQDMDGDGKTDIVTSRNQNTDLFILKNTSSGSAFSFAAATKISLPGQFNDITTADFNRDGKLDLIATSLFSSQAMILLNKSSNSAFSFDTPITVTTDAQPFGLDVCDLNGDRFPDFIVPSRGVNTLNVFLHNGNVSGVGFNKVTVPTAKNNWYVRAADLDGDAKPDIAFTSFTGTTGPYSVDILRNKNCHKPEILNSLPLTLCPSQTIRLLTYPMPGLTYNWSNGFSSVKNSADPFADITAAASYTVTATGEGGACAVTSAPVTISSGAGTLPADPVILPTTPVSVCTGTTLSLSTNPVSGATYSWTGPNNFTSNLQSISIPSATVANAGVYSLTIKSGDCSSNTVTKRVDVVNLGSFTISSSSASNTICKGQTLTLTVTSATGYTYQWMKDGANITGATSTSLAVTDEGSYKVKVSNTSLSCSQETSAVAVTAYVAPVAAFAVAPKGCVNNAIAFTDNSVTDSRITAVVYNWQFGDNSSSDQSDPTHTYTAAQSYNPSLTVSYPGITGCSNTVSGSINIVTGTVPVIAATANELCANGSETSTLSVSGTFNAYLWSTNATASFIEVTTPDTYTVETTDANNCKGTATITLTEKTTGCSPAESNIDFPAVFTPNDDAQNDLWIIPDAANKQDCTMSIFDGRGRRIYQKKGFPVAGWNGISDDGSKVPDGTYYFIFNCPDTQPATGSVLIVR